MKLIMKYIYINLLYAWNKFINNNKNLSDIEIENKLQKSIDILKEDDTTPRLNSITHDEDDYLKLSKISYSSTEDEFTLKLLFESDKSEGKFTYTFDKEG